MLLLEGILFTLVFYTHYILIFNIFIVNFNCPVVFGKITELVTISSIVNYSYIAVKDNLKKAKTQFNKAKLAS